MSDELKTAEDVTAAQEELGFKLDAYLRNKGWKQTCDTPGCFWLWGITLKGEKPRSFLLPRDMALSIQAALEAEVES